MRSGYAMRTQLGTDPAITFAIPFYQGVDYLERAIRSVFAQSSPNWQLLVCDDSPGGVAEAVVQPIRDSRVRYVRNPVNLGMAKNWNRGLDLAETDLVTLLHADDELLPNYAVTMTNAAEEHTTATAFFCKARIIGPDGQPLFSLADRIKDYLVPRSPGPLRLNGSRGIASLLRGNFVMCPTVCYRRSRIQDRRFDHRWRFVLDLEFFTRLLSQGDIMLGLPDTAYAYRRHPGSATTSYTDSLLRFHEEAELYDELAASARRRGWNDVVRIGRAKRMVRLHLAFLAFTDALRGRVRNASQKLNYLWRLTYPPTCLHPEVTRAAR